MKACADSQDDASALSIPAMNRWNKILRVFTAEYLGLIPVPVPLQSDEREERVEYTSRDELVSGSVYYTSMSVKSRANADG